MLPIMWNALYKYVGKIYISETARTSECVIDDSGRDKNSHLLNKALYSKGT